MTIRKNDIVSNRISKHCHVQRKIKGEKWLTIIIIQNWFCFFCVWKTTKKSKKVILFFQSHRKKCCELQFWRIWQGYTKKMSNENFKHHENRGKVYGRSRLYIERCQCDILLCKSTAPLSSKIIFLFEICTKIMHN